jgi:hypothetical protein
MIDTWRQPLDDRCISSNNRCIGPVAEGLEHDMGARTLGIYQRTIFPKLVDLASTQPELEFQPHISHTETQVGCHRLGEMDTGRFR